MKKDNGVFLQFYSKILKGFWCTILKILVTGSTGFVGSNIVEALLREDDSNEIALFVRNPTKLAQMDIIGLRNCEVYEGDITNQTHLEKAMEFNPSAVIHAAALVDDWASMNKLTEVNVQGTKNLVDAICSHSTKCFLIHISSTGVYPRITSIITEETPLLPFDNYHKSKLTSERVIIHAVNEGEISATILRPPNVMGLRDTTHMLKICQAIKDGKFPLINSGTARQTWLGGEDLARAAILTLKNSEIATGKVYNLKSFEITVKKLYDLITTKLKVTTLPKTYNYHLAYLIGFTSEMIGKIRGKPSTLNRYRVLKFARDRLFDDTKIRGELGYYPICTSDETISKSVEWLLKKGLIS